jgi:hypothetical protein
LEKREAEKILTFAREDGGLKAAATKAGKEK